MRCRRAKSPTLNPKSNSGDICGSFCLEQVVADEFEGVLAGPPANAFAVAGEVELFDLGVLGVGEGDVDETDWLVGVGATCAWAWSGDAGDRDAERCASAVADALCEGAGYLA